MSFVYFGDAVIPLAGKYPTAVRCKTLCKAYPCSFFLAATGLRIGGDDASARGRLTCVGLIGLLVVYPYISVYKVSDVTADGRCCLCVRGFRHVFLFSVSAGSTAGKKEEEMANIGKQNVSSASHPPMSIRCVQLFLSVCVNEGRQFA